LLIRRHDNFSLALHSLYLHLHIHGCPRTLSQVEVPASLHLFIQHAVGGDQRNYQDAEKCCLGPSLKLEHITLVTSHIRVEFENYNYYKQGYDQKRSYPRKHYRDPLCELLPPTRRCSFHLAIGIIKLAQFFDQTHHRYESRESEQDLPIDRQIISRVCYSDNLQNIVVALIVVNSQVICLTQTTQIDHPSHRNHHRKQVKQ
jgi:hypothetical protein